MPSTVKDEGKGFELPDGAGTLRGKFTMIDMGGAPLTGEVDSSRLALVNGIGYSSRPKDAREWFYEEKVLPPGSYVFEPFPHIRGHGAAETGFPEGLTRSEIRDAFARFFADKYPRRPCQCCGAVPRKALQFVIHFEGTGNLLLLVHEPPDGDDSSALRGLGHAKISPRKRKRGGRAS